MRWRVVSGVALFAISLCVSDRAASQAGIGARGPARAGAGGSARISDLAAPNQSVPVSPESKLPSGVRFEQDGLYSTTDPRPLERTAALIRQKLGVPVSYEDAAWGDGDVMQAADYPGNRERALSNPGWRGPLIPKGGTVIIALPAAPEARKAMDVRSLIQQVLNNHNASHNPGNFQVISFGENEFSIVPAEKLPPLSSKISFPDKERSLNDTIELIC